MKINDLKRYKPLDITELPGKEWSAADKVLGLDENDKVVMAEPDAVTYEYVDNAIDQAMEAETARTESTYLKESALDDYATKEYVDEAIGEIDLSDYSTTDEMNQAISGAIAAETARTEATYAKPSQIPSLDGYATEEWVEGKGYLTEHQSLDDYYTKEQVDEAIENVDVSDQLVNYALTTAVTQDIQAAIASETARTESTYLKEHQDISGKLDKTDFNTYTGATETALAGKLDTTAFTQGMASETARTEDVYAKKTEIPSLTGYATEEWVEGKGYITGVTVDAELTSSSTNAVQSKAIYDALNGVSSSSQMEISSVDSTIKLEYRFYGSPHSNYMLANFKETNIDGYYAIDLGDLPVGEAQNITQLLLSYITINNTYYGFENYSPETSNLGQKVPLLPGGGNIWVTTADLGDTYDYYLVLNTNENYVFLSATLPAITEVTDHKANISDLPTAQDGGVFKQFVYDQVNGSRRVITKITGFPAFQGERNRRNAYIALQSTYWTGGYNETNVSLPNGNEAVGGVKTRRDSKVISKAEEALNGFEEQITLTIGSASTDTISLNRNDTPLFETNDSRYLVIQDNVTSDAFKYIGQITLSGITYYIQNPMIGWDSYNPVLGKYQLGTDEAGDFFRLFDANNNLYLIIDKELLTLDIADSLTITRAKNIQEALDNIPAPDMSNYYTKGEVDSEITGATQDMATETWVQSQGYLTQHQDISGKLDASTFNTYTGNTETILDGKADISDIPDVSDFVTSGEVATQIGTAMASETARTEDVYAKKNEIPSLDGYATEQYVDNAIAAIPPVDLSAYAKTTAVTQDIQTAIAAETARTESTYLKEHQDISGKLDKTDFNTYTGATETALEGKVDLTTYTAYTGSTATAIAAKQDTLVSGTNIKTINNQSLLGSGNIDIQGGGGGGGNVVELTKAQYDALDPPAADTTYIITDAETVDLNDYAMASGLSELSGTVETLSNTKADKANTTARSGYFIPSWNEQGIITGTYTQVYTKSQGINGSSYSVISANNNNHPSIYAPTSAGTAGQPLLSNGTGAPVWGGYKFAFITQTQYDALATKDATTIYFITGD